MLDAFTARVYDTHAATAVMIAFLWLITKSATMFSRRSIALPLVIIWRYTGSSFSPSSTASSCMRFLAFSIPACAVLLKILYSRVADVASSKALFASCCSHLTISSLPDSTDSTCAIRMPSIPKSLNSGERAASASLSPI